MKATFCLALLSGYAAALPLLTARDLQAGTAIISMWNPQTGAAATQISTNSGVHTLKSLFENTNALDPKTGAIMGGQIKLFSRWAEDVRCVLLGPDGKRLPDSPSRSEDQQLLVQVDLTSQAGSDVSNFGVLCDRWSSEWGH